MSLIRSAKEDMTENTILVTFCAAIVNNPRFLSINFFPLYFEEMLVFVRGGGGGVEFPTPLFSVC